MSVSDGSGYGFGDDGGGDDAFGGFEGEQGGTRKVSGAFGFGGGGDEEHDEFANMSMTFGDGDDIPVDYEYAVEQERHPSVSDDVAGEWLQQKESEVVKRLGDILPRKFRLTTTDVRVLAERKSFNNRLRVLRKRGEGNYRSNTTLKDLKIGRVLGEGNFGKVMVCTPTASGKKKKFPAYMALKMQHKRDMVKDKKELQHVRDEKNLMYCMESRFLVGCVEYFMDKQNLYFLLELCNAGEMWSIIQQAPRQRLPPAHVKFWLAQVLCAFEYMHNLDIAYRDLKPENLLVDFYGNVKITDFGFAKRITDITWTMCGTPDYMAPEIIQQRGHNHAVDWWAYGVLAFELASGRPPFDCENQLQMFKLIQTCKYKFPSYFTEPQKEMIAQFLVVDTSDRLGSHVHKGIEKLKALKYFAGIDFDAMIKGKAKSPYKVKSKNAGDVSNFDKYDEPMIKWYGDGPDKYGESFAGF